MIPLSYDESDCMFAIYPKLESNPSTWALKPKRNSKSDHKYTEEPERILHESKFCIDSEEYAVGFGVDCWKHELEIQSGQTNQACQVGILTRPDRPEPKFGFAVKFCTWKPD